MSKATKVNFNVIVSNEEFTAEEIIFNSNNIKIKIDNSQLIMPTTNLALEGKHNIKNAMAASTVAHLLKIRKKLEKK